MRNLLHLPVTGHLQSPEPGTTSRKPMSLVAKLIHFILLFVAFLPATDMFGQTVVTFNSTTTWTCPAGVTSITVECWGGGGAGGGARGNPSAGGGGGGGSYVKNTTIPVVPGTTYTVTVAAPVNGTTNNGANGNDSWFNTTATILAKGGLGGPRANSNFQTAAGAAKLTTGNVGAEAPFNYYGGAGGTGGANGAAGGGGGSSAGTGSDGNNAPGITGGAAVTGGGAGVDGSSSSADGADNPNLGGGGAGARAGSATDRTGGNGGPGQVRITYTEYYCPASTAISPVASQSVCIGGSATMLTATITMGGIVGTPTLQYQWYYNTSNTNNIGTATLVGGETSSTFTPPTGTAGTRYYFCVGYASDNSCGQTNATQTLASNTVAVTVNPSMSGTFNVGPAQVYTTLTAAIAAYNSACLSGPVTFILTSATYSGSETFPITINDNPTASATNTLTIRPNTGVNATITGAVNSAAVIRIRSKYVTIDGSNNGSSSRNLTISNTSVTSPNILLIGSTGTTPITDVTVKNCTLINGVNTSSGILLSDGAIPGSGGYFYDITIQNNSIQRAWIGLYCRAVNTGNNGNGLTITSNDLTTSGANAIRRVGIYVQDVHGATVSNNSIANFETATTEFDMGVWLAAGTRYSTVSNNTISNLAYTGVSNTGPNGIFISTNTDNSNLVIANNTITNLSSTGIVPVLGDGAASGIVIDFASSGGEVYGNIISNIKNTNASGYGCSGIQLSATSIDAGFLIYNNIIFDVASRGSTTNRGYDRNGHGITICSGGGYQVYNNTILMNTNQTNSGYPSAINITSGVVDPSAINLRNNIFVNTQTQAGERYTIMCSAPNTVFAAIDYNDYHTSGTNLGYIGSNRASLADIQTGFGSNTNSLNILPVFVSSTDLHIQTSPPVNEALNYAGTPIPEILSDIDAQTRNVFTPDMGADEFRGRGSWIGTTSTSWTTASNWFDNYIPLSTTHVEIAGTAPFMPVVSSSTHPLRNLVIEAGGSVTVSGTGILQVAGKMGNSGTFNVSDGTIEMTATEAQVIPAGTFQSNSIKDLIISNTDNVTGVTLGGTLDVYRSLTFGAAGRKLTTGGYLNFKSTATQTAWLGQMTGSNTIDGNATVERYIPLHAKAWQFLAAPTSGQTINAAWQEGNTPLSTALNPAYGTLITNHVAGTGFDIIGGTGPSMKTYDPVSNGWVGIANTTIPIYNSRGYMLFVRGDRTASSVSGPTTSANLRTSGTLFTPANPPSVINLAGNTFESIGNPYPSAIDLTALSLSGGVQDVFYVWDPKVTTSPSAYGLGAYQTFTRNGATYDVTPGGGSYPGGTCKTIESGQAFFVRAPVSAGSVTFTEACKVSGSSDVNRVPSNIASQIRTNMYVIVNGQKVLIDGNLVQFDASYQDIIDMHDAVKLGNTGENLGIKSGDKLLVVERRSPVKQADTIFYNLGQVRVKQYEFELVPRRLTQEGLEAFLEDKYLGTKTAVSLQDTTRIVFNVVNVPGSYATDRFRLVFRNTTKTENPAFETARNAGAESIEANKEVLPLETGIAVYPNPVENKKLQLQFVNQPIGKYSLQLVNNAGQQVYTGVLQLSIKDAIRLVQLESSLPAGVYSLSITDSNGKKTTQQVIIK